MTPETTLARLLRWAPPSPMPLQMSRNNLPGLCAELGFTRGAEIGVWKGAFTAAFCEAHPSIHMLAVDPWLSYPAWLDTKNALPPDQAARVMEEAYAIARARLAPLHCTIVRTFSADAAHDVEDASLDFVYIDGNHVEAAVYEDLTLWAPKVRVGGLVTGHDYRAFRNKPTIHVIEAVQRYTADHGIDPWFITAGDRTPSFLWVVR